jgi:hypothetical protein
MGGCVFDPVLTCETEGDCPAGAICHEGRCAVSPSPLLTDEDGGPSALDAGPPDAGGGGADGGEDAGIPPPSCLPGQLCRPAAGVCDFEERCGADGVCPPDRFVPPTETCRHAAGECDVEERCSGSAAHCPLDGLRGSSVQCRSASDLCDAPEFCDGRSVSCPADLPARLGTACRPAPQDCDVLEVCNGIGRECPADLLKGAGETCGTPDPGCESTAPTCSGSHRHCTGVGPPVQVNVPCCIQQSPSGCADPGVCFRGQCRRR